MDTVKMMLSFLHHFLVKTLFIQPRHNHAPEHGDGHIYSPTSPWTAAAKLIAAGADVDVVDENIRPANLDAYDVVGANLVGLAYVPTVRERFRSLLEGGKQQVLFGGVVVSGMTIQSSGGGLHYNPQDFHDFFGPHAIPGSNLVEVARSTGAEYSHIPQDKEVSLIEVYKKIPDADMQRYLEGEISFFLAQGCNQHCVFCAAPNDIKEDYREKNVLAKDLLYLTERAQSLGLNKLSMYLSNLDIFQTPEELGKFFSILQALKKVYPGFAYGVRGLAITSSLVRMRREFAHVLDAGKDAGLHKVGLGVDGGDNQIRRNLQKGFVNDDNVLASMAICKEYDLTPETIMVFGGPQETKETLENAFRLTGELQEKFGAIPRPHVFKDLIPGNQYWSERVSTPRAKERKQIMKQDTRFCQAMDFKALASSVSHPDAMLRYMVNEYYRRMLALCQDPKDRGSFLYPIAPEFSEELNILHAFWNTGRYDR